ncbi:sugar ABC transporter substrate-binding protein [Pseudonocardia sp. WMMC193]|uniref:sugar ABC transporter substrate-binding protein n=1 Tax=Pseudonocardia sp. WMMC193 TaxID=2911965 RepID=UPI001F308079|nr:sugar ABC transporter substrate-binding protein [Pseudonocardia sp. WMMC193]MCF7548614.1 sugar ABC transporter substrate-binding protein [Pseudonocardia sp. WMMC193]
MKALRRIATVRGPRLLGAVVAVLALSVTACSTTSAGGSTASGPVADSDMIMVSEVRSLTNPYEAAWVAGSQAYADSLGIELKTIVYNGDSQQALSQLQSVLAGGKKVLLNINPNTTADTPAIVEAVKNAGGFVVTQWSKPDDLNPWDVGDNWVAYVSYDGLQQGRETGAALAQSLNGRGGVIALQGLLANDISKSRFAGFQEGLSATPGVTVLDQQPADFDRNKAYSTTKTLLNKYGDEVKGVWAATDSMALGALQAVTEAGKAGQIKIASSADSTPEGLQAIQRGDMVATYSTDPYYNGAMGLALAYQAATGKVQVGTLPHSDRSFYVQQFLVTKENVDRFATVPSAQQIVDSVADPLGRNAGPITQGSSR